MKVHTNALDSTIVSANAADVMKEYVTGRPEDLTYISSNIIGISCLIQVYFSYGLSWVAQEPKSVDTVQFARSGSWIPGKASQRSLYDL